MGVPRPESQACEDSPVLPPDDDCEDSEDNFRTASNLALRFCFALLFSRFFFTEFTCIDELSVLAAELLEVELVDAVATCWWSL